MNIENLCEAIKKQLHILKSARKSKTIDHSKVEEFQNKINEELNKTPNGYKWEIEKTARGRSEKDSVDILGQAKGVPDWVIEIDATRADQLSKKLLSRLALLGLKNPIQYVAILYPDTQKGKNACEKYLRYGNEIIKKINRSSSVVGIFIDPEQNTIEIQQFDKRDHFEVNGKECKSMGEAAAEAIKFYLNKHKNITFEQLKQYWGKFVEDKVRSKSKNIKVKTSDGISVHTYTQFRQYGICSYWTDFEKLCRKKRITIAKMRKLYIGGVSHYEYRK